jgi:DNA-binding winged helix-turn-helix (wHTH) protein/TolB-like protein
MPGGGSREGNPEETPKSFRIALGTGISCVCGLSSVPIIYAFGPFRLDAQANVLYRETTPVALGLRAVTLLRVLVEQQSVLVAKETLIDAAWPGLAIEDSNLTVQIAALRRALGAEPGAERWIETLPRRGYRFCGPAVTRRHGDGAECQPAAPAASPPSPGAPSPPALGGGVPVADLDVAPMAGRRLDGEDEACHPLPLHAESGVNGRASRVRFADAIVPRGALWVFRRTGWLAFAFAPGPDGRRYLPVAMLLLATMALLAAFWLSAPRNQQALVAASTDATEPRPPLPSSRFDVPVTILPFTISLGAPPPGLGEHIANDLATHLPRSTMLRVVPSQGLSDPAPDFKAIGARLGVRYVVTGTVSTQDEKLRVSVALIDARHGSQVLQLHATEDHGQWPSVHEEFIHRTTFAIHFQALRRAGNEPADPDREPTVDQLLGRGHAALLDSSDSPRFGEAEAAFSEVLRREPEAVPAMVGLANYYIQSVADLRIDREPHLTQAEELLRRALTMRTHYYPVHYQLALLHNL